MKKRAEQKKRLPCEKVVIYLVGEGTGETISKIVVAIPGAKFSRENVRGETFLWLKISSTCTYY